MIEEKGRRNSSSSPGFLWLLLTLGIMVVARKTFTEGVAKAIELVTVP